MESLILIAALTVRFFSNPTPARRRFYLTLSPYLWMNALVVITLGYLELQRGWRYGIQDAAWELPYVGFFVVFAMQPGEQGPANRQQRSPCHEVNGVADR